MKYLTKLAFAGMAAILSLAGCSEKESVPPQPDFIIVSGGGMIQVGTKFNMSVPMEGNVESYLWKIPETLAIVSGETESKITVYAQEDGVIQAGTISVTAMNSNGKSYARTLYNDIVITPLPPRPSYMQSTLTGSLTVDKDQEIDFWVPEDKNIETYAWSVPTGIEILSGQATTRISAKVTAQSVNIPASSISVTTTNGDGIDETHHFEKMLCVLPLEGYKTKRYGEKTWMIENLRYSEGGIGRVYDDNPDPEFERLHGRLYTWHETMSGTKDAMADVNPAKFQTSGVDNMGQPYTMNNTIASHNVQLRGICPEGWHVPNAYDRYDLLRDIAIEADVLCNSAAEAMSTQGIFMYHQRETNDGPTQSWTLTTYGPASAFVRGGRPDAEEGGIWSTASGTSDGGKIFTYQSVQYNMYNDMAAGIGYLILPSGQWKPGNPGNYAAFGQWSYHWIAATNGDNGAFRMTVAYNNLNYSGGFEAVLNANSVRCVANY